MLFRTHLAFGILLGLFTYNYFNEGRILYFFIVVGASIIVDVDSCKSFIGRKIKIISWMIENIFGHRTIFHSLVIPISVLVLSSFYDIKLGIAFLTGYIGHLFLDMLSVEGISLFYPIRFRIKGFLRVGGIFDRVLFFILVVVDFVVMMYIAKYML